MTHRAAGGFVDSTTARHHIVSDVEVCRVTRNGNTRCCWRRRILNMEAINLHMRTDREPLHSHRVAAIDGDRFVASRGACRNRGMFVVRSGIYRAGVSRGDRTRAGLDRRVVATTRCVDSVVRSAGGGASRNRQSR